MPAPILDSDTHAATDQIGSLSSQVYQKYALIEQRLNNIVAEGEKLQGSWSATVAEGYFAELATLKEKFDNFGKQHASFLASLKNFSDAYDAEEADIQAKIAARTSNNTGGGGPAGGAGAGSNNRNFDMVM